MKTTNLLKATLCAAAIAVCGHAVAQSGAPHSVTASPNFSQVTLNWSEPTSPILLKWHDGKDYNGMSGRVDDPEGTATIYAAAKFTPSDLKAVAGEQIDSVCYWEYRHCHKVNVQIYENGQLVSDTPVDLSAFTKNSWKRVALSAPYTIPADKDVMVAVKYTHGSNLDFVANTDREPRFGKGDLYSYDGKKWQPGALGDFLITATVHNNATETPLGYNIYRDGVKINTQLVTATDTTLNDEPDGTHRYEIGAVYASQELKSAAVEATAISASELRAPAATFTGTADHLDGTLQWSAPLASGQWLTWSGETMGNRIGGTSSSAPKLWIKQEFNANDMLAFQNYQINSISAYVAEQSLLTARIFVMKNGEIDYSEEIPNEQVTAAQANAWATWSLATPYVMTPGNTYAYGVYYTHKKSAHPVGVDNTTAIDVKGNSFSVSSPKSGNFDHSTPSWKTLSSGKIPGNFMLKAGVTPTSTAMPTDKVTGYDLYRDGTAIATGLTALGYNETVTAPGTYTYTLQTNYESGKSAPEQSLSLTYTMPGAYEAPTMVVHGFDPATKQVNLEWSTSAANLQHYGSPSYVVGFDEDMTMLYGAKFTADELNDYAGYQIRNLKFAIGAALDSFALEVRTGDNQLLYSETFDGHSVTPQALYTLTLEHPIDIPAGKDLYFDYNATLPAGTTPVIVDAGPAAEGGAMVSLSGGANWMKLGTIASSYKDYNIVIGATIMPAAKTGAPARTLSSKPLSEKMDAIEIPAADLRTGFGIEALSPCPAVPAKVAKRSTKPVVKRFKVYRNNALVSQQESTIYSETLVKHGQYHYYVTSIFDNGWESPASKVVSVNDPVEQLPEGPYYLQGTAAAQEAGDLQLNWQSIEDADQFNYQKGDSLDMLIGMTKSSGNCTAYCAIMMPADTLANFAQKKISHIKFKLATTEVSNTAVFVMVGDNIICKQAVVNPVTGWNVVRLNRPIAIEQGQEMSVGYYCEYASGVKPHVCDGTAPAVAGYNDLISSSAAAGYWKSLSKKYHIDYGWRISAVLMQTDTVIDTRAHAPGSAPASVTYNVYRNSQLIAGGLNTMQYYLPAAKSGKYTVTAVENGVETAPSNVVEYLSSNLYGDLNGDGIVNVTDVTALINTILGTADYSEALCDLNDDGIVNVTDVTTLINHILSM